MQIRNTSKGYGSIAIAFHWTMAALMIGLFAVGKYMTGLDPTAPDTFAIYQWHKSFGFLVLGLAALRLAWRFANPSPALPRDMPAYQRAAAHLGHAGLYALLFALPISGWLMVSASPWGIPTVLFNVIPVPHLPVPEMLGTKAQAEKALKEVHELLGFVLLALFLAHVAAALKHHFINRDTVLKRMLSTAPAHADSVQKS
jgi:cytochrome b561